VWAGADTETDPVVVLQARSEDKAPGLLRAASIAARSADAAQKAAWSRLREAAVHALLSGMKEQSILLQYGDLLDETSLAAAREASYMRHEIASRARRAFGSAERVCVRLSDTGVAVSVLLTVPSGLDRDDLVDEWDEGPCGDRARARLASDQAGAHAFLQSLSPRFTAVTKRGKVAAPASMVRGAYQYEAVTVYPSTRPDTSPAATPALNSAVPDAR
jgi:hypothetical protein